MDDLDAKFVWRSMLGLESDEDYEDEQPEHMPGFVNEPTWSSVYETLMSHTEADFRTMRAALPWVHADDPGRPTKHRRPSQQRQRHPGRTPQELKAQECRRQAQTNLRVRGSAQTRWRSRSKRNQDRPPLLRKMTRQPSPNLSNEAKPIEGRKPMDDRAGTRARPTQLTP